MSRSACDPAFTRHVGSPGRLPWEHRVSSVRTDHGGLAGTSARGEFRRGTRCNDRQSWQGHQARARASLHPSSSRASVPNGLPTRTRRRVPRGPSLRGGKGRGLHGWLLLALLSAPWDIAPGQRPVLGREARGECVSRSAKRCAASSGRMGRRPNLGARGCRRGGGAGRAGRPRQDLSRSLRSVALAI